MTISNEWKKALSATEYQYFCENVSLFDLAFYEHNGKIFIRDEHNGLKLKHSIIAYKDDDDEEKTSAISVNIPKMDLRSKPLFVHKDNYELYFQTDSFEENLGQQLKIRPLKEGDYYYNFQRNSRWPGYAPGFKVFDKEAIMAYSNTESFFLPENNPFVLYDYGPLKENDIVLSERNDIFKNKYLSNEEHLFAYNSLYISYASTLFNKIFYEYYSLQNRSFNIQDFFNINKNTVVFNDGMILFMLKNCYVSVLCPFFADIIDYKDFNQSLSPDSNVVHKNILVSSKANLKRFDEMSDDAVDSAETTRPYIPTTTPLSDHFSKQLFGKDNNLEEIFDEKNKDLLGALQTESFEKSKDYDSFFTSSAFSNENPPFFYDKNSRNVKEDYIDPPIVVPKDGNILVDGRIFSLTIDEIWEAIKRIEFGRSSDEQIDSNQEIGYPYSESMSAKTKSDTRPLKARKFNFDGKVGDPLEISYDDSIKPLSYRVEKWVNDPEKIDYNFMDQLKDLITSDFDAETLSNINTILDDISKYAPSEQAYSLRELESLLRGLQLNLAYVIKYAEKYFTRVGKVGKILNRDAYNENAGTAYQLHRDYHNGIDTTYKGADSISPITIEKFGKNQNEVPSYSVFMSANGTWQSVSQCMRLRIRDDEEF